VLLDADLYLELRRLLLLRAAAAAEGTLARALRRIRNRAHGALKRPILKRVNLDARILTHLDEHDVDFTDVHPRSISSSFATVIISVPMLKDVPSTVHQAATSGA
jgi:hypothetical protein